MSADARAVFLSCASQDAEVARVIAEALRAAGVEVWFDQRELVGGDAWDAKIRGRIASCALFVPIISANTQARTEGYFRLEWKLAEDRSHLVARGIPFIVPLVIDATTQRGALVPEAFLAVQWTRVPTGEPTPDLVAHLRRLLGSRARGAGEVSAPDAPVMVATHPAKSPRRSLRRFVLASSAGLLLVVIGVLLIMGQRKLAPDRAGNVLAGNKASVSAEPVLKSIAVLPFVNLGADKADEYLGDGMTEELLHVLAKVKGLRVPGRTSSFAFKGRMEEGIFRKVGEQLNVGTVLEGSVRKAGDKLRITVQLINVADGYHLWSETYDRDLSDILAVQSDVAQRVVQALQVKLGLEETRALAKPGTQNADAHRLYLQGRHHFARGTQEAWASAIESFKQAIAMDPDYALAYCGIADTYNWMGISVMPGREAWAIGTEWARKALALDPALADAHLSLGIAISSAHDWRGGESAMLRAIELNPNLAFAHDQLAWLCWVLGRPEEAAIRIRKAVELDPLSPIFSTDVAAISYFARRYDEGIAQATRTLALHPGFAVAHVVRGWSRLAKGDAAGAAEDYARARALDDVPWYIGVHGGALAMAGERSKAEAILRELVELSKRRYINPGAFAAVYLGLDDKAKTLDWLERAYEEQDGVCWNLKVDPIYDPLRAEPRFQALIKKLRFD
jgi:adenylate cyclase